MPNLLAFAALPADQLYQQSLRAIAAHNHAVAEQPVPLSLPIDPSVTQALNAMAQARELFTRRFSEIYSDCAVLRTDAVRRAESVTTGLDELADSIARLGTAPGDPASAEVIGEQARRLSAAVSGIESACRELAGTLGRFNATHQRSANNLQTAAGAILCLVNRLNAQVCEGIARLNALENAPFTQIDQLDMAELAVRNDIDVLTRTGQYAEQTRLCGQSAGAALSGLSYLVSTWQQLGMIATTVAGALQAIADDPASAIATDLHTVGEVWQRLLDRLGCINTMAGQPVAG